MLLRCMIHVAYTVSSPPTFPYQWPNGLLVDYRLISHPLTDASKAEQQGLDYLTSRPFHRTFHFPTPDLTPVTLPSMKQTTRLLASHIARPESFIVASKRTPFGAFGGKYVESRNPGFFDSSVFRTISES